MELGLFLIALSAVVGMWFCLDEKNPCWEEK